MITVSRNYLSIDLLDLSFSDKNLSKHSESIKILNLSFWVNITLFSNISISAISHLYLSTDDYPLSFLPFHHLYLLLRQPILLIHQPVYLRINNSYLPFVKLFIAFHARIVVFLLEFELFSHQSNKFIGFKFKSAELFSFSILLPHKVCIYVKFAKPLCLRIWRGWRLYYLLTDSPSVLNISASHNP